MVARFPSGQRLQCLHCVNSFVLHFKPPSPSMPRLLIGAEQYYPFLVTESSSDWGSSLSDCSLTIVFVRRTGHALAMHGRWYKPAPGPNTMKWCPSGLVMVTDQSASVWACGVCETAFSDKTMHNDSRSEQNWDVQLLLPRPHHISHRSNDASMISGLLFPTDRLGAAGPDRPYLWKARDDSAGSWGWDHEIETDVVFSFHPPWI